VKSYVNLDKALDRNCIKNFIHPQMVDSVDYDIRGVQAN